MLFLTKFGSLIAYLVQRAHKKHGISTIQIKSVEPLKNLKFVYLGPELFIFVKLLKSISVPLESTEYP